MISNTHTPVIQEDAKHINTNRQVAGAGVKESRMKLTASNFIRWTGLSAIVAGIIFAGIQPFHPADVVESVNTTQFTIILALKTVMCYLMLFGIAGIYARQMSKAGWIGLVGFLMLGICWATQLAYVFAEAFIFPLFTTLAPKYVDGLLGVSSGRASEVDLGANPALYGLLVGGLYMLGGLVFGIATFRANILPRWTAVLLAGTAALTPLAVLFPHNIQRFAAVPMALSMAVLGYALWSERREQTSEAGPGAGEESPLLHQTAE
jgi:hypothetical protein